MTESILPAFSPPKSSPTSTGRTALSLVRGVPDLLLRLKSAVIVPQFNLVERLRLVKTKAVQRPNLISVGIRLSSPGRAIPQLPAGRVTTSERVTPVLHFKLLMLVEFLLRTAIAPVRPTVGNKGTLVTGAEGGRLIVEGLMVCSRCWFGADTITARSGMELSVDRTALIAGIESSGREGVMGVVEDTALEDLAGLFSFGLHHVVVIDIDARDVALVAWEDS